MSSSPPLIVGAGPVGLGAALFLARHGIRARVIETRTAPAPYSKALAVNPRTLDLLEPSGVAQQMLQRGLRITGAQFHHEATTLATLSLAGVHPRHPHMTALSQATTERLLAEAFIAAGGLIERGVRLVECRNAPDPRAGVEATLESEEGAQRETVQVPWLLAADGAHSTVREACGIPFEGDALPGQWHLADAPLRTQLDETYAHFFFQKRGGFLFMIRVVDDVREESPSAPLWRILSNEPDPLTRLEEAEPAGAPLWTSSFTIAHRVSALLTQGNIHLAGDAAHVHSPMGARGMNLGLEDAWVFAELAARGELDRYDALRRPVDRAVVRRVRLVSRLVAGIPKPVRLLRTRMPVIAAHVAPMRNRMLAMLTGLDHALPF